MGTVFSTSCGWGWHLWLPWGWEQLGEQMGRGGRVLSLKKPVGSDEGGWGGGDVHSWAPASPLPGRA